MRRKKKKLQYKLGGGKEEEKEKGRQKDIILKDKTASIGCKKTHKIQKTNKIKKNINKKVKGNPGQQQKNHITNYFISKEKCAQKKKLIGNPRVINEREGYIKLGTKGIIDSSNININKFGAKADKG